MNARAVLVTLVAIGMLLSAYILAIGAVFTHVTDQVELFDSTRYIDTTTPHRSHRRIKKVRREPYGGCKEAYLYPNTPGGRWCARHNLP